MDDDCSFLLPVSLLFRNGAAVPKTTAVMYEDYDSASSNAEDDLPTLGNRSGLE
jgi:hypothetical protein